MTEQAKEIKCEATKKPRGLVSCRYLSQSHEVRFHRSVSFRISPFSQLAAVHISVKGAKPADLLPVQPQRAQQQPQRQTCSHGRQRGHGYERRLEAVHADARGSGVTMPF